MPHDVTDQTFDSVVLGADVPVLVDFWAEWCAPCKVLAETLDEVSNDLGARVKIVKLDAASNPGIVTQYGVRNMPTLLLFKDGEPADMKVGAAQSRAGLTKWLESHAN